MTQTVEIIGGHEVIVHIGTPKDDYFKVETPYGIQFSDSANAPQGQEDEDVVLPWTLPPDAGKTKSKTPDDVQRELTEYLLQLDGLRAMARARTPPGPQAIAKCSRSPNADALHGFTGGKVCKTR